LTTLGIYTVQEFIQYYIEDVVTKPYTLFGWVVSADDAKPATSFFLLALLLGAIISSVIAGKLSDVYGAKPLVYISGALQGVAIVPFLFFYRYTTVVCFGFIFGLGYGAYQSVDWKLGLEALPSLKDYARDIGIWHFSMTAPQIIAPLLSGFLLDTFQNIGKDSIPFLGYYVIFSIAILWFALSTVLVRLIKLQKHKKLLSKDDDHILLSNNDDAAVVELDQDVFAAESTKLKGI